MQKAIRVRYRSRQSTTDPIAAAAETQKKLAEQYAAIFSVLLKHKKDILRVTFRGVYDKTSWIGGSPMFSIGCAVRGGPVVGQGHAISQY